MKLLYALIIATSYATVKPQGGPRKVRRGDGMEESVRKLAEGDSYEAKSSKSKSAKGYYNYS